MKKLRKLKDGGGNGGGLSKSSVRPWIFNHSIDLKRHEIQYMDLNKRETQQKARPKNAEDFLGDSLDDDLFSESDHDRFKVFVLIIVLIVLLIF